ncbi:restriction endonuclease subunit S [Clostridium perfringens]
MNKKLENVQWGEYRLGDLFEIKPTKAYKKTNDQLFDADGNIPVVTNSSVNNGVSGYSKMKPTEQGNIITYSDTTTSEGIFYQPYDFVGYSHIQGLYPKLYKNKWNASTLIFIVVLFKKVAAGRFNYGNKFNRAIASEFLIHLPTQNGEIDFEFMESFVAELEAQRVAELEAYLLSTGLKDYELTDKEKQAINDYDNIVWSSYNLKELFGKSTRGKRLKSSDRIDGFLPFVTAGETNEGISAFIGNNVQIFSKNTTTIDMFGSAKYRNYDYGGDDHIAVVHTEDLPMKSAIFVTTSINKSSHNGQFNYGKNFYAKDADELNIMLPEKSNKPNYTYMETLISAIQKLVIRDVVIFADRRIEATKQVID